MRGGNESEVKKGEGAGDKYFCLRLIWLKIWLITSLICKLGRMFFLTAVHDLSLFFSSPPPLFVSLIPNLLFFKSPLMSPPPPPDATQRMFDPSRRTHVCARPLTSPQGVWWEGGGRLPKQINKSQPLSLIWPSQSHADLYRPHQQKMLVGDSQRWCGGGRGVWGEGENKQ